MSKKEELIKKIAGKIFDPELLNDYTTLEYIYDEIRASILTPKVVALLKTIGSKPETCYMCTHAQWDHCHLQKHSKKCPDAYEACPLLTSEELKELTE